MNTTTDICLDSFEEYVPDEACPLEVEVRVPNEYGGHYLRRKRWRTFREILRSMREVLNRIKCHKCGQEWPREDRNWWQNPPSCCGPDQDLGELIDEYDSCGSLNNEDSEIGEPDEHVVEIVCYCHVGGNEGYYAEMGVLLRKRHVDGMRFVPLYRVKSFRGMEHVHDLVRRMMLATGAWPEWCNR